MGVWEAHALLAERARQQFGVIGLGQLDELGVSREQLRYLTERGIVHHVAHRAYEFAAVPPSWRGRLQAWLFALGADAVVSHEAAAKLHGLDRFQRDVLEFTVTRTRRGTELSDVIVHTSLVLPDDDVVEIEGLRVTSPARTIIDLAGLHIKTVRVEAAIDSALRLGLTDVEALMRRLNALRGKGRRGVERLETMLITSGGHSILEREFLKIIEAWKFPNPQTQVVHEHDGRFVARVDFLFPDHGIVVEVSGGRGHSTAADRAKDARRRNELQDMGRLVLEFTYEDVMEREPYVVRTLRQSFMSGFVGTNVPTKPDMKRV
jgi:hypothetical protein